MLGTRSCLAIALAATLVTIATPAQAAPSSLVSLGPGILVADGAAVDVPITFVCNTDPAMTIVIPVVQVTQKVSDGRIAGGGGNDQLSCTRQTQTATIRVIPSMMAFNEGAAAASVFLQTCTAQYQCSGTIIHTEITLENPADAE